MHGQAISSSTSVIYSAISAYLDNFEIIEKSIGKEISDASEQVLRVQLRDQINKVSITMHYLVWYVSSKTLYFL